MLCWDEMKIVQTTIIIGQLLLQNDYVCKGFFRKFNIKDDDRRNQRNQD